VALGGRAEDGARRPDGERRDRALGREEGNEKGRARAWAVGSYSCCNCGERNGVLVPFSWVMSDQRLD
jgi:hypothetical protein